jgi:outer membrane efflux protein
MRAGKQRSNNSGAAIIQLLRTRFIYSFFPGTLHPHGPGAITRHLLRSGCWPHTLVMSVCQIFHFREVCHRFQRRRGSTGHTASFNLSMEDMSLIEATEGAVVSNPEVIEAQQTAIKAHAGLTLTKLQYVPTVAITGGYANQSAINNRILPKDFGYIGVIATFTLFDGFKREHGVKEVNAQAEMADLAVRLTKAKVAAGAKSSYLELDRSRQLYQLARRMVSAGRVVDASYHSNDPEVESAQARMEADMFRAELEYRQAYAKVKALRSTGRCTTCCV